MCVAGNVGLGANGGGLKAGITLTPKSIQNKRQSIITGEHPTLIFLRRNCVKGSFELEFEPVEGV